MNTTDLIREWSMDGAERDIAGRFRSAGDFRALFPGNRPKPVHAPLLVKPTDGEDWRPLLVAVQEPGERAA